MCDLNKKGFLYVHKLTGFGVFELQPLIGDSQIVAQHLAKRSECVRLRCVLDLFSLKAKWRARYTKEFMHKLEVCAKEDSLDNWKLFVLTGKDYTYQQLNIGNEIYKLHSSVFTTVEHEEVKLRCQLYP